MLRDLPKGIFFHPMLYILLPQNPYYCGMKVLMVCLGNICRSPLAEGILKAKVKEKGLEWQVESAGTGSWHVGEQPDPRSIEIANKNGLDISQQIGRQIKAHDLDRFDLIFAMDQSNYQRILQLATRPEQKKKVYLIMNIVSPNDNKNVPDPYWNDHGFEEVFQMLDLACDKIIERWQ